MPYLLDTNTCIVHLRSSGQHAISRRLRTARPGEIFISSIIQAELLYGALRSANVPQGLARVDAFCAPLPILPFDSRIAERQASVRAALAAAGTPIGPYDSIIAATALVHALTVVTHNTREFNRVAGLAVEDWQVP